jgi:hypothetical protein
MCLSIKSDFEKCLCISLVIFKVLYHEHFAQQLHVNILVVVSNQKYPYSEWCKLLSNIPDSENGKTTFTQPNERCQWHTKETTRYIMVY